MDFERARFNMIEQQIRPCGVTDPDVCGLLRTVRRENYVPLASRELAFADIEIALPCGQRMLRPAIEGRILQTLRMTRVGVALEVGAGYGHFAALLAARAERVSAVEIEPKLAKAARENLARAGIDNVLVEEGDGSQGWFPQAPYDVIVVSGGLPELSETMLAQLKPGGRLFAFVGEAPVMKACLIERLDEKRLQRCDVFETVVPMLRHAHHPHIIEF